MKHDRSNAGYVLAVLLLWALPLVGQLEIGDNTSMTMTGTVSTGYDGGFGESSSSSHGISVGGDTRLNGYYYSPSFLSFTFNPYYNRSQNNSEFQSISDASGLNSSANFFSGSHFPGFFNFSKAYNTSGTFGLPGVTGLETHGSGQTYSVGWSELLPDWPTLSANFTSTSDTSTVFGEESKSESASKLLDLHSDYTLVGFRLRGFFQHQNTNANFPNFLTGSENIESDTSSNSYGITAEHSLPFNGDIYGGWRRSGYTYNFAGGQTNATADTTTVTALFHPAAKVTFSLGLDHTSNLSGALTQEFLSAGVLPPPSIAEFASSSTQYNATAGYTILPGLYLQGQVTHLSQIVGGHDFSNTLFGGTVNYNMVRRFLGNFTFVVGVLDNSTQTGHIGTTLVSNLNYSRRIAGWDVGGHFSYGQNLQTLITVYTTSSYGYGGTVRRRLGFRTYWNGSFTGGHSGLSEFAGFSSKSESFSSSFTHGGYGLSASYSQSHGTSLLSPTGLVPVPLSGAAIDTNGLLLYDAKAWSFGASGSPFRKMQLSASFARSLSNTLSPSTDAHLYSNVYNMQARYPFRKLYFTGGYTRFQQGLGSLGGIPTDFTTYYFGLSRWFNFF